MKILYTKEFEHYGNESIILDVVSLLKEGWNLFFRHNHQAKGSWFDPVNDVYTIILDEDDISISQQKIDDYLNSIHLFDELHFTFSEYI
jgi:hypothetical protein